MVPENKKSDSQERQEKAREIFYTAPEIERLGSKFDLSEETENAATVIYRVLVGLGKGLSSSQKQSFSATAVWFATELSRDERPLKEELAEAVDISPRTLSRRFQEIEDDEKCKEILEHVKKRIKKWNKRKNRKLRDML